MSKEKRSFFERLTGTVKMTESEDEAVSIKAREDDSFDTEWPIEETEEDAELSIDMYQTPETIIIKSMIAGVRPEDLDISITRDSVTISGHREEEKTTKEDDYFTKELYWGSFSRTISLPQEVDVDEAEAIEKHGLLILKLPKLDKKRQSKVKVKTV